MKLMKHEARVIEEKIKEPAICEFSGPECRGRLTLHRAVSYAGKRIQEPWAWLWLCSRHHGVDEWQDNSAVDERKCREIALSRAPEEAREKYPRLFDL